MQETKKGSVEAFLNIRLELLLWSHVSSHSKMRQEAYDGQGNVIRRSAYCLNPFATKGIVGLYV